MKKLFLSVALVCAFGLPSRAQSSVHSCPQHSTVCPMTTSALQGKRIGVLGDSYVRNHMQPYQHTWHYKFAAKYGMTYYNHGRNGSSIAYTSPRWGEAMYIRYKEMPDSLDYVVVIAGHNDSNKLDSIGGIDIFKERLSILCQGLIRRYPAARISFFTPWTCHNFIGSPRQLVVDAMLEICGSYGIPVFDAARRSGIYVTDEEFRRRYFQPSRGLTDTAHLNAAGHDRFLPVAEAFLLQH